MTARSSSGGRSSPFCASRYAAAFENWMPRSTTALARVLSSASTDKPSFTHWQNSASEMQPLASASSATMPSQARRRLDRARARRSTRAARGRRSCRCRRNHSGQRSLWRRRPCWRRCLAAAVSVVAAAAAAPALCARTADARSQTLRVAFAVAARTRIARASRRGRKTPRRRRVEASAASGIAQEATRAAARMALVAPCSTNCFGEELLAAPARAVDLRSSPCGGAERLRDSPFCCARERQEIAVAALVATV